MQEEPPEDYPGAPPPDDDVHTPRPSALINRPAEQALLGAILLEPDLATQLVDHVDGADFYDPKNEQVWDAIHQVVAAGQAPDALVVNSHLLTSGQLTRIGHTYLVDLLSACPTPRNAALYADQVRDAARLRHVDALGTRFKNLAATATPETVDHAVAEAQDDLDLTAGRTGPRTRAGAVNYVAFEGLFSRPRQPIQWVIAPLLAAGRVTLVYSPGKTGKSLIAIEAAAAIATGRAAFATSATDTPKPVLYIDQEMTEDDWLDRLSDMGYDKTDEHILAGHLHLAQLQNWPPMDTSAGGRAVEAEAKRTGATTVIIDTASKVISGEENDNDTQQAFYRHTLVPLKRAGIAVLVLDHTGKDLDRGARGASAKTDNIDLAFELLQRGRDLLTLRCTHARVRDSLLDEPTFLRRTTEPLAHQIEEGHTGPADTGIRPTHLMERVSRYVEANPGATKTTIETAVKGRTEYVRLALELLILESYIQAEKGPRNSHTHHQIKAFREDDQTE